MNRTERILFAFGVVEAALVLGAYAVALAIAGDPGIGAYAAAATQLPLVPIITLVVVRNDPEIGIGNAMGAIWSSALLALGLAHAPALSRITTSSRMTMLEMLALLLCLYAGVIIVSNIFFLAIGNVLKRHAAEREAGAPKVRIEYVSPAVSIPAVGIATMLILIPLMARRPAVVYLFAGVLLPLGFFALRRLARLLKPLPNPDR